MMDSLERLRRGLAEVTASLPEHWGEPTLQMLREGTAALHGWRKAGSGDSPPSRDVVAEAIQAFCSRQEFASLKHARYTCFGSTDPRLMEDERRFPRLLDCVDEYRAKPRPFQRCYRGLLHGYVTYDPDDARTPPAGKQNWRRLRTYLDQRATQIRVPESTAPEWVDSITKNRELLTERACNELGRRALDGDLIPFESVCKQLEISDQSWVVRKFILAQLDAAAAKSDPFYRQLLPRLRELLERHPLLLDEGLGKLLERYRACAQVELDKGLRDFAVGHWGNPWLKLNDKHWGRVSAETRKMVVGWLKLKLMRDFFRLLSNDGVNDPRRLEFWLRYIDQIDDMYFALGNDALHNRDPDFKQIRNEMKGRLLHLHRSGLASNNAFLMSIGNHMMVEFGDTGNAFFAFDKQRSLPFGLEGYVAGDSTELKHQSHKLRLRHADTSDGKWEEHFERQLEVQLGIGTGRTRTRPATPTPTNQVGSRSPFSDDAFDQFVRTHGLFFADKRKVGGALWVYVGKAETTVTRQLKSWGFKYNEHKTGWWRGRD